MFKFSLGQNNVVSQLFLPVLLGLVPLILFRISGFCVYCLIFDFQGSCSFEQLRNNNR